MFINRGRIVFDCSMEELEGRYLELSVHPEHMAAARAIKPISERQALGRGVLLFDGAERQQLEALGEVRTPTVADLFVALMSDHTGTQTNSDTSTQRVNQQGAAR